MEKVFGLLTVILVWTTVNGNDVMNGDGTKSSCSSNTQNSSCSDVIYGMVDCISFISVEGSMTKPTAPCCSAFESVFKVGADCICEAIRDSAQMGIQLNMTNVSQLPSDCGAPQFSISKNCTNGAAKSPKPSPNPKPMPRPIPPPEGCTPTIPVKSPAPSPTPKPIPKLTPPPKGNRPVKSPAPTPLVAKTPIPPPAAKTHAPPPAVIRTPITNSPPPVTKIHQKTPPVAADTSSLAPAPSPARVKKSGPKSGSNSVKGGLLAVVVGIFALHFSF